MFEAARVGDDIGHSGALAGMIAGTIVGGLIAAAGGILAGAMFIAGLGASCLGVPPDHRRTPGPPARYLENTNSRRERARAR